MYVHTLPSCLPPLKTHTQPTPILFKARHLGGSAFCKFYRLRVSEQALSWIPLSFCNCCEDKLSGKSNVKD